MKKETVKRIMCAVIAFILSLAITIQLRTMAKQDSNVSQVFRNDELKNRLWRKL